MADAATASPWKSARVVAIRDENARTKTFRFAVDEPTNHRAGQHYVVRLTAPDGYTASRSYSVASAPDGTNEFELTVEHLEGGEVSTFLHEVVEVGDELEVRGPIGGWFVWDGTTPAVLRRRGIGDRPADGDAPIRTRARVGPSSSGSSCRCARPPTSTTPTRSWVPRPRSSTRAKRPHRSRARRAGSPLDDLTPALLPDATAYVCGSSGFADAASDLLVAAGVGTDRIRVERFGPSG